VDCAVRARVHRSTWSLLERGHFDLLSLATTRRCLAVLDVRLELAPSWRGADLSRLLDEAHAALQSAWKSRLERWGWSAWAELSFNRFGDRGRIDLLCWQPVLRVLLVVEVKTQIADAQALIGGMDVKVRVAPHLGRSMGLPPPRAVVPLLLVADTSTNRDRLHRLEPLFARFALRGRAGGSWLRRPAAPAPAAPAPAAPTPSGLLIFTDLRYANGGSVTRVAAHRVRRSGSGLSVEDGWAGRPPTP